MIPAANSVWAPLAVPVFGNSLRLLLVDLLLMLVFLLVKFPCSFR